MREFGTPLLAGLLLVVSLVMVMPFMPRILATEDRVDPPPPPPPFPEFSHSLCYLKVLLICGSKKTRSQGPSERITL